MSKQRILIELRKRPMTNAQIAEVMGLDASVVSNHLRQLKRDGFIAHDGKVARPVWRALPVTNQPALNPPAGLRTKMSVTWRGTPWQGMEAFL